MTVTRLEQLLLEEVSGVFMEDHLGGGPANELPGWLVQKSASGTEYRLRKPTGLADVLANIRTVAAAEGVDHATTKGAIDAATAAAIRTEFPSSAGPTARPTGATAPRAARKQRGDSVAPSCGGAMVALRDLLFHRV